jgi:hypothetical protein
MYYSSSLHFTLSLILFFILGEKSAHMHARTQTRIHTKGKKERGCSTIYRQHKTIQETSTHMF